MNYEVERKFRLPDPETLQDRAGGLGIEFGEPIEQIDEYFGHPNRDFASTDEALRLRSMGTQCRITYKGPKVDTAAKTRLEIELPFAAGVSQMDAAAMLAQLGFRSVAKVRKLRRTATYTIDPWTIAIDWDEVDQLGCFLELDICARENDIAAATEAMTHLQVQLGLESDIRESYLELLLAR